MSANKYNCIVREKDNNDVDWIGYVWVADFN